MFSRQLLLQCFLVMLIISGEVNAMKNFGRPKGQKNAEQKATESKDPSFCKPNPFCHAEQSDNIKERKIPFGSLINLNLSKHGQEEDKKQYKEAAESVKNSSTKLLELFLKTGGLENGISTNEFLKIMLEMATPLAELAGGPFLTTLMGVIISQIPFDDPALKAIDELKFEMKRQFELLNKRFEQMLKKIRKDNAEICYNERVHCVLLKLEPHYNDLISPTVAADGKAYREAIKSFLDICGGPPQNNHAYDALIYIQSIVAIDGDAPNCQLNQEPTASCILNAVYEDGYERSNLLSLARMLQIHSAKLSSMATLCANLENPNEYSIKHIQERIPIIYNDMSVWIKHSLTSAWPSIFNTIAFDNSITSFFGKDNKITIIKDSILPEFAKYIQSRAYAYGLNGYHYYVVASPHNHDPSFPPWEEDRRCNWDFECPARVIDQNTATEVPMCIMKSNYLGTNIMLIRSAFNELHPPIDAPEKEIFNFHTYDRTDNIVKNIVNNLPAPQSTAVILLTDKEATINKCPQTFAWAENEQSATNGYMRRVTEFGYPYYAYLFFSSVFYFRRDFKTFFNERLHVTGTPTSGAQRFTLNFDLKAPGNTDIALHFGAIFNQNLIVLNSFCDNKWDEEIRDCGFPFRKGEQFVLDFEFKNFIEIKIHNRTFCRFDYRYCKNNPANFDQITIFGDLILHDVVVETNGKNNSLL